MLTAALTTLIHGTALSIAYGFATDGGKWGGVFANLLSSSISDFMKWGRDSFARHLGSPQHINDDLLAALARGLSRAVRLGQQQFADEWNTIRHQGVANAVSDLVSLLDKQGDVNPMPSIKSKLA